MIKLLFIAAARPNFMKVSALMNAFQGLENEFLCKLVHTGQHYDANMSDTFFDQLNIPRPDFHLGVGGGSHAEQTGRVMIEFDKILDEFPPDLVVVVGDVNATLACALTACKRHIKVAHVESGLRSGDWSMPEEVNRILTDRVSDILFTTLEDDHENLRKEGYSLDNTVLIGNVMIDTLFNFLPKAEALNYYSELGLKDAGYNVLTLHRPSNVDDKQTLERLLTTLATIAEDLPIVWPLHPRTKARIQEFSLDHFLSNPNFKIIEPIGYFEMVNLMKHSACVLTDSGGLQEETSALKVPCITLRENTERPITVTHGSNIVVGTIPSKILEAYEQRSKRRDYSLPECWDGKSAQRFVEYLTTYFSK